jgi:O-antigen/teichoic acid export membrane protein
VHRKKFISNTVFLVGTSSVTQLVAIIVLPLFVENIGTSMYGLFVISNVLLGYMGLLDFGFTDGLMRQIGRAHASGRNKELADAVWTGFWLLLVVGLISALIIYFGRFWIIDFLKVDEADKDIASKLMTVTAVFSMLYWPMRLPETILNAVLRIKESSIVSSIFGIVSSLIMLLLVMLSMDVVSIRIGVCLVMGTSWLAMLWMVRRHVPQLHWELLRFSLSTAQKMMSFSLGMFYTRLLSIVSIRIDYMIIGGMLGVASITPYAIITKLFDVITSFTHKLFGALLPTVFNLDSVKNRHKLQTVLEDGVRYRALIISPIVYLGIVVSPSFIDMWVGHEYVEYTIWAQFFLAVILFNTFGIAVAIARGTGRLMACNCLLTIRVAVNLALSITLTPYFGIGGPILGTVISQTILGDAIALPYMCRICGLRPGKALKQGLLIIASNIPITVLLLYLLPRVQIASWFGLVVVSGIILAIMYTTIFMLFVTAKEKQDINTALNLIGINRFRILDQLLKRTLLKET